MRVWDFPPKYLCDKHLLAQHNEIHAIYSIIMNDKRGFSHHPEVTRWHGYRSSISGIHAQVVDVMLERGMKHKSPLEDYIYWFMPRPWQPIPDQLTALKAKSKYIQGCNCYQRLKEAGY